VTSQASARILVVQLKRVGDVLLCTPLLRALRKDWPERRIAFLTEAANAPLLHGNPNCDAVLTVPPSMGLGDWGRLRRALREERPGIVVDLSGTPRSCIMAAMSGAPVRVGFRVRLPRRWVYNIVEVPDRTKYTVDRRLDLLRAIGIQDQGFSTELFLTGEERREASRILGSAGFPADAPILAVAPTSRKDLKRWSPEGFASLAIWAREELQAEILLLRGPGEEAQEDQVRRILPFPVRRLGEAPPLRILAALVERSRVLVANDGGPKHLAAALGTRSVTVFVSTGPSSWHPPGDPRHSAVVAGEGLTSEIREARDAIWRQWNRIDDRGDGWMVTSTE
jgi:heptosyltransferase III